MKQNFFKPLLSAAAVAAALSGCTMIPKYEQPQVAVSETFKYDNAQNSIQAASLGWQDYFADPRLHRLIEIALERNTDLRTAALNAEALREQYRITRANLFPTVAGKGSGTRQRTAADLTGGRAAITESYSVGLGVSAYELDLFGKARSNNRAALESYFNSTAARAAFFPSITLTGSVGSASNELNNLFKSGNGTWAFAPSINVPIFTWGALKASLDAAKIRQQIQVVNYEAAVQSAFRDVADALVAREQLEKAHAAKAKQSKAYADQLRLIQLRYKHGVSSALDLLDAERSSYAADSALLASSLTRLENMADLYKALGGGLKRFGNDTGDAAK